MTLQFTSGGRARPDLSITRLAVAGPEAQPGNGFMTEYWTV